MEGHNKGNALFDDGIVEVYLDDTAKSSACTYRSTNESWSARLYPEFTETETVVGIVGGGEQILYCAKNPKVKRIIGIDINTSQVSVCMAKISLSYRNDDGKARLLEAAKGLWHDSRSLDGISKDYTDSSIDSHGFSDIYESLGRRFERRDLKLTLVCGDALKILPQLYARNATVYLSNLADCIDDMDALYGSLENFLESNSRIILCELSSDYYRGRTGVFADMIVNRRRDYRRVMKNAFRGYGDVLDEDIHILSPIR